MLPDYVGNGEEAAVAGIIGPLPPGYPHPMSRVEVYVLKVTVKLSGSEARGGGSGPVVEVGLDHVLLQ